MKTVNYLKLKQSYHIIITTWIEIIKNRHFKCVKVVRLYFKEQFIRLFFIWNLKFFNIVKLMFKVWEVKNKKNDKYFWKINKLKNIKYEIAILLVLKNYHNKTKIFEINLISKHIYIRFLFSYQPNQWQHKLICLATFIHYGIEFFVAFFLCYRFSDLNRITQNYFINNLTEINNIIVSSWIKKNMNEKLVFDKLPRQENQRLSNFPENNNGKKVG